jgi:acetyl esterase/lipase
MNDTTPWIDPELAAAGQLLQSRGLVAPDRTQAPLSEVRAATDRIGAFLGEGSVPLEREQDLSLPGPHGQVPCRLYLPDNTEKPPLIVYAHGGGFMQGSLPSWHAMLRELVRQSGVAALSVDYRLSPEYRFPVAFDEMIAMVRLAAREGAEFGIDPARLAIGGDSAGANLALAAALALRDAGERALGFMLLNLWLLLDRHREPVVAAFWSGCRIVSDPNAVDLGDLSRTDGAAGRLARRADSRQPRRSARGASHRRQR